MTPDSARDAAASHRASTSGSRPISEHDSPLASALRPPGPVHFELSEHEYDDQTVIRVEGEVDIMTAPKLVSALDRTLRTGTGDVTVDLTDATFLDSTGLHVLLNAARRLTRRNRRLCVVCGPGPVRQVIELARLGETLNLTEPRPSPSAHPRARPAPR